MTAPRSLPLLLALLGACRPDEPDPEEIKAEFLELHRRVYGVYALPGDRDEIWDLLSSCFTGPALTREYVEHWTSKARMTAEGTSIDIRRVDHDRAEIVAWSSDAAEIDLAWSVGGLVSHRGHQHPRVNRYEAVYSLIQADSGWRIVSTAVRDVARAQSAARSEDIFDPGPDRGGYLDPLDLLEAGLGPDSDDPGRTVDSDP